MTIKNKGGRPSKPYNERLKKKTFTLTPPMEKALIKHCEINRITVAELVRILVAKEINWSEQDASKQ